MKSILPEQYEVEKQFNSRTDLFYSNIKLVKYCIAQTSVNKKEIAVLGSSSSFFFLSSQARAFTGLYNPRFTREALKRMRYIASWIRFGTIGENFCWSSVQESLKIPLSRWPLIAERMSLFSTTLFTAATEAKLLNCWQGLRIMLRTDMSVDLECLPWVGLTATHFCRLLSPCSVPKRNKTGFVGLTHGSTSGLQATKEDWKALKNQPR